MNFTTAKNYREELENLEKKLSALKKIKGKEAREEEKKVKEKIGEIFKKVFQEFDKNIVENSVKKINQETILYSEFLGHYLAFLDLSTSQIRNIYGEVIKIKMKGFVDKEFDMKKVMLLKPRLAYSAARKKDKGTKEFRVRLEKAIDYLIFENNEEDKEKLFENFADFFEAILAYHKAFGGQ